jgi:cation-transporting P-type ATPase E
VSAHGRQLAAVGDEARISPPPDRHRADLMGLDDAEVLERRARGLGNDVTFASSRTYTQILRDNAFMSINVIIFAVGIALVLMGLFVDALLTVGLVLLNVIIAMVQEARAKQALDRIALLARIQATVIREGTERRIDPEEIVLGDLVVAGPGDQVMVDGRVAVAGRVEVDESLLTGESEPVVRTLGDPVQSGSFCVNGRLLYEATRVGMDSLANQLTAQARAFRPVKTPVQREIDLVLRLMVILILVLGGPIVLDLLIRLLGILVATVGGPYEATLERAYQGYSVQESVRATAVVIGLIPQGLALMLTVTYAMGAVRLAGRNTLLQQANAVESLSHVDVVCFDKTGTLTTNRLAYHAMRVLQVTDAELATVLGDYAATTTSPNRTIEAIGAAFEGKQRDVRAETAFSSARKWSAITYGDGDRETYVLGAPEILLPRVEIPPALERDLASWTSGGLRVLLLAHATSLPDDVREPRLPAHLVPCGLVSFHDELNRDAPLAIARFAGAGIGLKIISGDHPETVAALAQQAGFGAGRRLRVVSGLDLARMTGAEIAHAAEHGEVFGRITPQQKLELVRHLQAGGHYVAMVGDGVNDVLALKQAEVGIAMEHGSQASRAVADVVLLKNAFTALPAAFVEGQRIVRASQDLLKLFLARSLSMAVAIMAAGIVGVAFPFIPQNNFLPAMLTVGLPTVLLAAWARPGRSPSTLLGAVVPFALPAALTIGAIEATLHISYVRVTSDLELARTVVTTVAVLCGLLLILFVEPPTRAWTGGDTLSGDWRPVALVGAMLALFAIFIGVPAMRDLFALTPLGPIDLLIIGAVVTAWAFGIRYAWRARLMPRMLGLDVR